MLLIATSDHAPTNLRESAGLIGWIGEMARLSVRMRILGDLGSLHLHISHRTRGEGHDVSEGG